MPICKGVREIARLDCRGGGQITVDNGIAYIGHMKAPSGTSIVDVRDPMKPRVIADSRSQMVFIHTRCRPRTESCW